MVVGTKEALKSKSSFENSTLPDKHPPIFNKKQNDYLNPTLFSFSFSKSWQPKRREEGAQMNYQPEKLRLHVCKTAHKSRIAAFQKCTFHAFRVYDLSDRVRQEFRVSCAPTLTPETIRVSSAIDLRLTNQTTQIRCKAVIIRKLNYNYPGIHP